MSADPPHLPPTDEALEELTDSLAARFPAGRDEVAAIVRRAYEEVSADAPVDAYLVHLTEGKAAGELRTRYPAHH
ncbi:three-helix bundle dimerization domain-containing protein [Amycolatopsis sp. NPDC059021]|uniref:three-helix bundle dimerization domain-containing protein n=1 Tax=Amycolatopsis sp. NPDC059021 TaxID=3346704 RepID=UPI003671E09F